MRHAVSAVAIHMPIPSVAAGSATHFAAKPLPQRRRRVSPQISALFSCIFSAHSTLFVRILGMNIRQYGSQLRSISSAANIFLCLCGYSDESFTAGAADELFDLRCRMLRDSFAVCSELRRGALLFSEFYFPSSYARSVHALIASAIISGMPRFISVCTAGSVVPPGALR